MARLFLIPTTLATKADTHALIASELPKIKHLTHFIVETPKVGRAHLKHLELTTKLQELNLYELNKHQNNLDALIAPLLAGNDVGLISDCGMPAIADPGSKLVAIVHKHNIEVVPLIGPCSLILALNASGLNGQNFAFCGYLPIDSRERIQKIGQLQELITKYNQTQIIIETPFRNQQLFETLIDNLSPNITLTLAINLMDDNQKILSKPISVWRNQKSMITLHKQEVVFVIGNS